MQKLLQKAHEDIAQLIFKKEKDFVLSKIDEPRVSDVHRSSRGEKRWDSILPPRSRSLDPRDEASRREKESRREGTAGETRERHVRVPSKLCSRTSKRFCVLPRRGVSDPRDYETEFES